MLVTTFNINGIRSGAKKGFFNWMVRSELDIVCLQETKAQLTLLQEAEFHPKGYNLLYADAQKPGYSGVAIYSRVKPKDMRTQFGHPIIDNEGRFVQMDFDDISVVSLYLPSGTTGEIRQAVKYQLMDVVGEWMEKIKIEQRSFILCGDWNIAHKIIDLKNWKSNQKNSGFLPEERAWMDKIFDAWGFVDAFRVLNQEAEQYTWWSTRGQAYTKNVGWRLDYQIVTPDLKDKIKSVDIYKAERFSDHAPVSIKYAL